MTIYNPVRQPSLLDILSDIYHGSCALQFALHAAFLLAGLASVALLVPTLGAVVGAML